MKSFVYSTFCLGFGLLVASAAPGSATAAENPFVGHWALTIPGGGAGWLGVEQDQDQGKLSGSILWGGGSVVPVSSVELAGDTLVVTRLQERKGRDGAKPAVVKEVIKATVDGDAMALTTQRENADGKVLGSIASFTGKRIPPLPAAPDLGKVKFGDPISLFNGKDLGGWTVMNPSAPNGWSVRDGILTNHAPQEPGKHISYANIRTEADFEDFNLTLEVRVPEGGNSGVYLRGIYEVQVADTFGKPLDSHNMGGVYSRITPTVAAEKPAGQGQTLDITLVDRHVTVVLNGKKIIDNQPLLGCTGGALWSDEFRPGPIYLQGDHTSVEYWNIVLRPVVRK
ncbi:MAG: 3-keto-disaccharide hydrolase [Thermoguttaceae bacterium]